MMKRLAGAFVAISATVLTLATITPTAVSSAALDTADSSIPVNPVDTLQMRVTANCIAAEARCLFDTVANLRTPNGVVGFPGDLYARQNVTLRTMDRSVYINSNVATPNTRIFKSLTDNEISTVYFGGGPPDRVALHGVAWPIDSYTGRPRTDVPLIVCSYIQVVYAGVNLTSPNACAQAAFS
ncbi:hypothetical protein MGALJ_38600 [Mycobacterium gallinarum]|uniref:Secreted protein n=2 Tax=Mycobacteriaceae TaxID=1762 RepID=A0A9W4B527_9MYCO|nr:hypothetical protein MGALJ_38600 [Mycobacterium gallinarum]